MNTALQTVHETDVSGVLCFFVDTGRPVSAAHLMFRHGMADEPLPEAGWLHLLEHLALLDRETLTRPVHGEVSMLLTRFAALGTPEELTDHLGRLCHWLADPDFRLLARERGVLQARAHQRHDPLVRSLSWRYGATGPGVASYAEVGALRATPELLAERSWRVFNAANAVLVLDGPPPPDLKLALPDGEYLPPAAAEPVRRRLPAAYRDDVGGLTLTGVVSRTHEATFLPAILERAVHDGLRQRTGGAYAPWSSMVEVDDQHLVVGAGSDVVPEILGSVGTAGLDVIVGLAEDGVPRAWLEDAVQQRLARLDSPTSQVDVALESAYAVLSDRVPRTHEELRERVRTTNPQLVDAAARELHATLLVGLPDDAALPNGVGPVAFAETEPAPDGGERHSHVNWPADLSTFAVHDGVAEHVRGTTARRMPLDEVVGMYSWRDGTRRLVGRDGATLEMEARQWVRGTDLTRALDEAVPSARHLPMPDREVTFSRMGPAERAAVGFARVANTKPGLITLLSVTGLLTLLALLGRHRALTVVLLGLTAFLGAQLWRIEGARLGTPAPSPATSEETA